MLKPLHACAVAECTLTRPSIKNLETKDRREQPGSSLVELSATNMEWNIAHGFAYSYLYVAYL